MHLIHATVLERGQLALWVEHVPSQRASKGEALQGAADHPHASDVPLTQAAVGLLVALPSDVAVPTQPVTLYLPTSGGAPLAPCIDVGPAEPEPVAEKPCVTWDADLDEGVQGGWETEPVWDTPGTWDTSLPDEDWTPSLALSPSISRAHPIASRSLVEVPEIAPWSVPACVLEPSEATLLLAHLPREVAPGLRLAPDLEVWSTVARWTLSLLLRGRFVPCLTAGRDDRPTVRAGWQPVFTADHDAACLSRLAQALPPSGTCHSPAPPCAREHITAFVSAAIDALARHWLARAPRAGDLLRLPSTVGLPFELRAWLDALRAGEAVVEGRIDRLQVLGETIGRWQRGLLPTEQRLDFRTGFRLEAPDTADGEWRVAVFLEAVDTPSITVTAHEVWNGSPDLLIRGALRMERPQERLLADLGRALRIFSPLERVLVPQRQDGCVLDRAEAGIFVRSAAWLLQESGFAVSLPPWATDASAAPRLSLTARERNDAGTEVRFGLETLLEYEWRVALGGDVMEPAEFARLAALKVPLVRLRDGWALLEPTPAAATLDLLAAHDGGGLTLRDALQLSAGADPGQSGLPPVALTLEGELATLLDARRIPPLPAPLGLCAQLRPYQAQGVAWMADRLGRGLGVCLADDMGLGKTLQLIALLLHDRGNGPWLLICPTSLIGSWVREIEKFAPTLRTFVHHGRGRLQAAPDANPEVVITTYGLAARDADLRARRWRGVALDEAQHVKNADARQAQGVRAIPSALRIAMTGTPVENRLTDLWSLMDFLAPGLLGTIEAFRKRFAVPIERYGNDARREHLRQAVSPFLLRRVKTDPTVAPDLPEKIERAVFCTLTREQASLYEATVRERLASIDSSEGIARRGLVLSTMLRLKQICNHPAHFLDDGSGLIDRSGKLQRLEDMLEGVLACGERALIFTQFREWAIRLSAHLRDRFGVAVDCLHGECTREDRDRMVTRFQGEDGPPLLVLSVKAGGVGLTLTRATHVFHYDRWWNPAVENQATDRAFRIGQRQTVQVHKFVCQGTLEESIHRLLEIKHDLAEGVVGSGEAWLTECTTDKLAEMFALRESATEDES